MKGACRCEHEGRRAEPPWAVVLRRDVCNALVVASVRGHWGGIGLHGRCGNQRIRHTRSVRKGDAFDMARRPVADILRADLVGILCF